MRSHSSPHVDVMADSQASSALTSRAGARGSAPFTAKRACAMPVFDEADDLEGAGDAGREPEHAGGNAGADGKDPAEALSAGGMEFPAVTLSRLKEEAQKMKAAKKALLKQLRNAKRVNQRLKAKAKKLSDADLLAIVAMRQSAKDGDKETLDGDGVGERRGCGSRRSSSSASGTRPEERAAGDGAVEDGAGAAACSAAVPERGVDYNRLAERMAL